MSGVDTSRGIAYQHCETLLAAIEVVEDAQYTALSVETGPDVADFTLWGLDERPARIAQAKTRVESRHWSAGDLVSVITAWSAEQGDIQSGAEFQFLTDGSLGPSAVRLREAVALAKSELPDAELQQRLAPGAGRDLGRDVLKRLHLLSRRGAADALLAQLEYKVIQLRQHSVSVSPEEAEDICNAALRQVLLRAGDPDVSRRRMSRDELCEWFGIPKDSFSDGRWTSAIRRELAASSVAQPSELFVDSGLQDATTPAAMVLADADSVEAVRTYTLDSLTGYRQVCVVGPTGSGKTASLRALCRAFGAADRLGIIVSSSKVAEVGLQQAVTDQLRVLYDIRLSSAGWSALRADSDFCLAVDGAGDLGREDALALRSELEYARTWSLILSGRDAAATRAALPVDRPAMAMAILPISTELQTQLAQNLIPGADAEAVVRRVIIAVGEEAAGNPLIFRMSLSLLAAGETLDNLATSFRNYLTGLIGRSSPVGEADILLSVWGVASLRILTLGPLRSPYLRWLAVCRDAIVHCETQGLMPPGALAASDAMQMLVEAGLLLKDQESYIPLHDGLAEWSIAFAAANQVTTLPDELGPRLRQVVRFVCEMGALTVDLARRLSAHDPVGAVQLRTIDRCRPDYTVTAASVGELLSALLGRSAGDIAVIASHGWQLAAIAESASQPSPTTAIEMSLWGGGPVAVMHDSCGPLSVAVELWGASVLHSMQQAVRAGETPRGEPADEADLVDRLRWHFAERLEVATGMAAAAFGDRIAPIVLAESEPFGVQAHVHGRTEFSDSVLGDHDWYSARWMPTGSVDIRLSSELIDESALPEPGWSQGDISHLLLDSPASTVSKELMTSVHRVVGEVFP